MDYQEAIESHINECRHRIYVIRNHVNANGDADKDVCNKNIDVLKIAISAMQELQEYKKLGTLEEVQDAVERQQAKKPVVGADVMVGRDDDGNPIWENDYACAECGMGIAPEYVCCPYCETVIDWSEGI